jgi:hypothetical protein
MKSYLSALIQQVLTECLLSIGIGLGTEQNNEENKSFLHVLHIEAESKLTTTKKSCMQFKN